MPTSLVQCTGAEPRCDRANDGLGCYHRKPHEHTNNCSAGRVLDTGLSWCSFSETYCKCEAAEAAEEE